MKIGQKTTLILGGLAALALCGFVFYKRNLKKIENAQKLEKKEFEDLGVNPEKLEKETSELIKDNNEYGDIRRFSELPYPCQLLRLLDHSSRWPEDELDWRRNSEGSKSDDYNSIHVVFKEHSIEDYHGIRIGFFIEVPPILNNRGLTYKDYKNFLRNLSQKFWAKEKVECARPSTIDIIGLYSKAVEIDAGNGEKVEILQYYKIPDEVLIARSPSYGDRVDGLYNYFSDANREANKGINILPDDVQDIHVFTGVWFPMENPERTYGGITMKQVLKFLEEIILKDNYTIEDPSNPDHPVKLGPVIIHPEAELEYILDRNLKIRPIVYGD